MAGAATRRAPRGNSGLPSSSPLAAETPGFLCRQSDCSHLSNSSLGNTRGVSHRGWGTRVDARLGLAIGSTPQAFAERLLCAPPGTGLGG